MDLSLSEVEIPRLGTRSGGSRVEAEDNSRRENPAAQSSGVDRGATQADSAVARSDPEWTHIAPSYHSCRRKQRFDCAGWAEIHVAFAARPERGKTLNLRLGRCYVEAEFPFAVGTQLEIVRHVNNLSFRAIGSIAQPGSQGGPGRDQETRRNGHPVHKHDCRCRRPAPGMDCRIRGERGWINLVWARDEPDLI